MGSVGRLISVAVLVAGLGTCQLLPRSEPTPSPSQTAPATLPASLSPPPARDLGSPDPPATVRPIMPP